MAKKIYNNDIFEYTYHDGCLSYFNVREILAENA